MVTSRNAVDVVLDKEIDHWDKSSKEGIGKDRSKSVRLGVLWGGLHRADNMGDGADQVHEHGNVVNVMIIRRCDIDPTAAGNSPDDIVDEKKLCKALGSIGGDVADNQKVPEGTKSQART